MYALRLLTLDFCSGPTAVLKTIHFEISEFFHGLRILSNFAFILFGQIFQALHFFPVLRLFQILEHPVPSGFQSFLRLYSTL